MRRGGGVPVVGERVARQGEGKGLEQLELVPRCTTYNHKKLLSPPPGGGQWTLNLKLVHS